MATDFCPVYAPFFVPPPIEITNIRVEWAVQQPSSLPVHTLEDISDVGFGAAYGTAKCGVGVTATSVLRPDLIFKSIIPVVMAGIIGIYGLVVAVMISDGRIYPEHSASLDIL